MNNMSVLAGNCRRTLRSPGIDSTAQASFYKAYASQERFEGRCTLVTYWKEAGNRRDLTELSYVIYFNHEGVKEERFRRISLPARQSLPPLLGLGCVSLSYAETAALLQDVCGANTCLAAEAIDRAELFNRLCPLGCGPRAAANIYLAALRRSDRSLLYDMSGSARKADLGDRSEYLLRPGKYDSFDCLQSGIRAGGMVGGNAAFSAYAVFSSPEEEIIRTEFRVVLSKHQGRYYVEEFFATGEEKLDETHPDNPLNYPVYCSVYRMKRKEPVRKWLEGEPDYFLTGEIKGSYCYKELKGQLSSRQDFNVSNRISAEFILTPEELIVFAKNSIDLARAEKAAVTHVQAHLKRQTRSFLPIRELFGAVFKNCE